jgi:hypothetical protein
MNKEEALAKLDEKINRIIQIKDMQRFSPEYKKWHRETRVLLGKIFGADSYQVSDFKGVNYLFKGMRVMGDQEPLNKKFRSGLDDASAILTSIKEELLEYGVESEKGFNSRPMVLVEELLKKFHAVVKQMRRRYNNRSTLDVHDEYDVQDLLHSLLKIFFQDIRTEEWTPSYAGSSARMDFLLKEEKIVIETKMTRKSLNDKDLVDQLLVDINRYQSHPDCETLICFIYDPEGRIVNRQSIMSDVSNKKMNLKIMVFPEE